MVHEVGNMNETIMQKFQNLLRTLFQFDCADLDFGIYRIINYKRNQVEAFVAQRLPQIVDQAFAQYAVADRKDAEQEVGSLQQEIRDKLNGNAIDAQGHLKKEFHTTRLGKQYLLLLEKQTQYQVADELKTRVYNDLYTFFSRYYEDGDFISKRRYGRNETYAIPYSGEEVVLYWANRDQYYIKTGERFKAYRFKADDYTVAFELRNVEANQNGGTGKKRYFVLANEDPVTWNDEQRTLAVAFEYRSLTEAESKEHGKTEQQKPQDSLNQAAEKEILRLVADGSLRVALAKPEGANGRSLLLKRLTHFTRRNTADFFIHKDLRGFLRRELDFFIKNEVLLLDELIGGVEEDLREHVQRGRVMRQVAEAIIDFLAQVEDYQKKLWEKRKFVLRTEYCLTIDRVPEELWDSVLANKAQVAEYRQLYSIEGKVNKSFLKAHPTLVVDTRHFLEDFKSHLLASFDDLDKAVDGLLIKSENWQALNLLLEKYRQRVQCIHIDPPYNTQTSGFLYKNDYQHSSWLTMMGNRLAAGIALLTLDGSFLCHIDENEYERLHLLCDLFPVPNAGTVVWDKRNPMNAGRGIATQHEYIICLSRRDTPLYLRNENIVLMLKVAAEIVAKHGTVTEEAQKEYAAWIDNNSDLTGGEKAYRYLDEQGRVYQSVSLRAPEPRTDPKFHIPLIHPVTKRACPVPPNGFSRTPETLRAMIDRCEIIFGKDETIQPRQKVILRESSRRQITSVIQDARKGKADTDLLGLDFPYCHPVSLYEQLVAVATDLPDSTVFDYFAGSGTTAHAIINLNRKDGGRRKYMLADIEDSFETAMLPRIKKVVFCEKWRDGKPQGGLGVSHLLKYQYLEQYEDTLNNLELPRAAEGQKMLEMFGDEYLLKYMLGFESQGSPCLLNLDMFKDPFTYRLKVQDGDEIVERPVDLVETFNYLLGIQVRKVKAFQHNGRPYRAVLGEKNGKRTAIVWRSVVGLEENEEALMKDKDYIEQTVLPALLGEARPDRLLVNGACFVKDAEAIEPEFKRLMFAPVGA